MDFSYFDIVVIVLVLLLGLKGILNGFFKEFFGLLGIIGGIFVASRVAKSVGEILSNAIFKFESSSAINFSGFLVTLAAFWLLMVTVGIVFKKLSSASGLGFFDRIFGFIFSAGKFFFIASVIVYATHNVKALKANIEPIMKHSIVYPMCIEVGGYIMKLDTVDSKDANSSLGMNPDIKESAIKMIDDTKKLIDERIEQNSTNLQER